MQQRPCPPARRPTVGRTFEHQSGQQQVSMYQYDVRLPTKKMPTTRSHDDDLTPPHHPTSPTNDQTPVPSDRCKNRTVAWLSCLLANRSPTATTEDLYRQQDDEDTRSHHHWPTSSIIACTSMYERRQRARRAKNFPSTLKINYPSRGWRSTACPDDRPSNILSVRPLSLVTSRQDHQVKVIYQTLRQIE